MFMCACVLPFNKQNFPDKWLAAALTVQHKCQAYVASSCNFFALEYYKFIAAALLYSNKWPN